MWLLQWQAGNRKGLIKISLEIQGGEGEPSPPFSRFKEKGGNGMSAVIKSVEPGSYAEEHGIKSGCTLLKINGHDIVDVLDYRFYMMEQKVTISYRAEDGKIRMVKIEKDDEYDDLGIEFETYLIDKQHSCNNKCIFCFIDQLPEGMRESLYFKDDDSRMSFFYGNYITLTNLSDEDIDRIIKMHISPVNVSVHTMNEQLRCEMMNNRFAGDSLRYLKRLADAGISINAQLVLCPGINDGDELEYSIRKLYELSPSVQSVACVPVGLTRFRDDLSQIEPYNRKTARETIRLVDKLAHEIKPELGSRFCYAADEFYLMAELPIPDEDYYDDYPQLDNGVGLMRLFNEEVNDAVLELGKHLSEHVIEKGDEPIRATIATGLAAEDLVKSAARKVQNLFGGAFELKVRGIVNVFFGPSITVSGLLTGEDIIRQLRGKNLGSVLFLPKVLLRDGETVLLDDVTIEDIEKELDIKVVVLDNDGYEFVNTIVETIEEVK